MDNSTHSFTEEIKNRKGGFYATIICNEVVGGSMSSGLLLFHRFE